MSIHKCFDETLKKYNITGASLARQVGISPSHISQFRNGKGGDVSHTTLEKMLEALESLAPGSKLYFCLLLAGKNPVEFLANPSSDLSTLVLAASQEEKAEILNALADWVLNSRKTTDTPNLAGAI